MQRKKSFLLQHFCLVFVFLFYLTSLKAQNTEIIGAGHYDGVSITTSDNDNTTSGENTLDGKGLLPNLNATSRFLGQATLGADYETIENTATEGISNWLDAQFATPTSLDMEDYILELTDIVRDSMIFYGASQEELDELRPFERFWTFAWWQYVMTSPDVLRARVALALSEIFVVSEAPDLISYPLVLADYYKMLMQHSFGNYRDLLYEVSLHPAMGTYLSHMNNPKSDVTINRFPDENYAREIMQLFSIGLYQLHPDGTRILDGDGNFIPTYSHTEIAGLAKVFTGLSWGTSTFFNEYGWEDEDFEIPMQMFNDWHEPGTKQLFNGIVIPNRVPVDGMADINDAIDHLFNHQNVGPFIGTRLIQRLVTSNPSPEYVARVTAVFNDNGAGVRGDFKAVIRAILTDKEARDCSLIGDPHHGMLREPLVRYTHISRAFNAASTSGRYNNSLYDFRMLAGQSPLGSPTVFNFFRPDYQPIGPVEQAGLVAPEFQITNSQTVLGYANLVDSWAMDEYGAMEYDNIYYGDIYYFKPEYVITSDLSDELLLSDKNQINELVERYNLLMMHGNMSEETRTLIVETLAQIPDDQPEIRVRMALFLVMLSPDYLVQR